MCIQTVILQDFVVDQKWNIRDLILNLEQSRTIPEVVINGNKVPRESDSYLSFLLDLSKELSLGQNHMEIIKN
ncbi:MAG: hypothetical protein FWF59_07055 [Turicibacter sp.]|nr:hypothetical protein [Turicibacter sp.]